MMTSAHVDRGISDSYAVKQLATKKELGGEISNDSEVEDGQASMQQQDGGSDRAPMPLVEFTYFPDLPIEVRLIIWRHACKAPRIIKFTLLKTLRSNTSSPMPPSLPTRYQVMPYPPIGQEEPLYILKHNPTVPELLQVNSESRSEARRVVPRWRDDLSANEIRAALFNGRRRHFARLPLFRYDIDIAKVSLKEVGSDRMRREYFSGFFNGGSHSEMPVWINSDAAPIIMALQKLRLAKTVAINREYWDWLPKENSLWHLTTWVVQGALLNAEKLIVLLNDEDSEYSPSLRSGPNCPRLIPDDLRYSDAAEEGVICRRKDWASKDMDDKKSDGEDEKEHHNTWEDPRHHLVKEGCDASDTDNDSQEADKDKQASRCKELGDADGGKKSGGVYTKGDFPKVVNNIAYAQHVLGELRMAKKYMDADPSSTRRKLPLEFEVCSEE